VEWVKQLGCDMNWVHLAQDDIPREIFVIVVMTKESN
jgi:hypothetical protein